jgi:hypothetical protein
MLISVDGGDPRDILQAAPDKAADGDIVGLDLYLADPRGPSQGRPDFKVRHYDGQKAKDIWELIYQQTIRVP